MVTKTLNDVTRDEISSNDSISDIMDYFSKLNKKKLNYVLDLILSDIYKIDFFIDHSFDSNDRIFEYENNIQFFKLSIKYLKNECLKDPSFLLVTINATKRFSNLDLVNKSLLMEELELNGKDNLLSQINKFHILDKIAYSFIYELDCFKEYYYDYIKKYGKYNNTDSLVTEFLTDKMLDLKNLNYEKYIVYIHSCIQVYYKWNFYNKCNRIKDNVSKKDLLYLNVVKNESIRKIFDILEYDYDFLNVIIRNYLYYTTIKNKISEKEVDEYFFNNVDETLQKKLNMKK